MLARIFIAVVSAALVGCGGSVGSTADAATKYDANNGTDAGIDLDAWSFDIFIPDAFEDVAALVPPDAGGGPCVPLDAACATVTQCCPLQNPQGFACLACAGVCFVANCHQ